MTNVLTMTGAPLQTAQSILEEVQTRDDVAHVVLIVETANGYREIFYDRQEAQSVIVSAAVLSGVAAELAKSALIDD